jgi:hypothetical protein
VVVRQDVAETQFLGSLGVVADGSRIASKFGLREHNAYLHCFASSNSGKFAHKMSLRLKRN